MCGLTLFLCDGTVVCDGFETNCGDGSVLWNILDDEWGRVRNNGFEERGRVKNSIFEEQGRVQYSRL